MSAPSFPPSVIPSDDDDWQRYSRRYLPFSRRPVTPPCLLPVNHHLRVRLVSSTHLPLSVGGSRRTLLVTQPRSTFERLCLGLVRTNKFCSKERLLGSVSCGTTRHETSKFSALPDYCYVKVNETQAHCSPTLAVAGFTSSQVQALTDRFYTIHDWGAMFDKITSGSPPDWFPSPLLDSPQINPSAPLIQPLSIMSPTAGSGNLFYFHPTLSFNSSDSSIIHSDAEVHNLWRAQVVPPKLMTYRSGLIQPQENQGGLVQTLPRH